MKSGTEDRLLSDNQWYHINLTSPYNLKKEAAHLRQPLTESIEVKKKSYAEHRTRNAKHGTRNAYIVQS